MLDSSPCIIAQGISKYFLRDDGAKIMALSDISLEVPTGSITALVGADGAGKTTLMRLVCGVMRADSGTLQVLGLQTPAQAQEIQNRISYMPQRFGLYEDLTIQENLNLYADLHGVAHHERQQRFARLLDMTQLAPFTARLAGKLSGGMKQKLGLACTLVRSPELLLLDEPSVGVDPLSRQELWQIINQLIHEERLTVLLSTTYMDEAAKCGQVLILHEGNILTRGTPQQISEMAADQSFLLTPETTETPRTLQAYWYDQPQMLDAVPQMGRVRLVLEKAAATTAPTGAQRIAPSLEDAFMLLLRQSLPHKPKLPAVPIQVQYNTETVIQVCDLTRKFGDFVAVDHTTFNVYRGEIFGLLGPNGAGKTTTFRMLCGLLPASDGTLEVAGMNLRTARASARKHIGYVSQKFALYGDLSVKENLEFFGGVYGLYGKKLQQRIQAVVEEFDLQSFYRIASGKLPGGFKQRLAMATGLLHQPEILFLDEPTSGADPLARRDFWRRITSLAAEGTTIIITTHFMEEAEYCDRMMIQDAGKMLALGTPQQVREQAAPNHENIDMEQAFIRIIQQRRQAETKEL